MESKEPAAIHQDSRKALEDRKTVDAVIRNLMIIGEAAVHVPESNLKFSQ